MRFHKDWASIFRYILKEDKEPFVLGEYTRQQIIGRGESKAQKV